MLVLVCMRRTETSMGGRSGQGGADHPPDPSQVHSAAEDERERGDPAGGERPGGQQVDARRPHLRRRPEGGRRSDARLGLCQFPLFRRLLVLHPGQFYHYSIINKAIFF